MIIRKIDSDGDWNFGKGKSDYAREEAAIEENILTRLKSWKGDCFFAPNDGVDWANRLEYGQLTALVAEVKSVIFQSFGVVGVTVSSQDFNETTRAASIQYAIDTIFGTAFQSEISQAIGGL